MHSSPMLREGARPEIVRATWVTRNIGVTQNVYGKSWWEERVDAVTQAVEAITNAAQMPRKKRKGISLNPSATNGCPLAAPAGGQNYKLLMTKR